VTDGANLGDAVWLKGGALARLIALLDCDGEEARVVGGAVRNALMRLPVGEVDVATSAASRRPAEKRSRPASSTAPSPR
jgi:poly(A) polymerase